VALTGPTGAAIETDLYEAFGKVATTTGSSSNNRLANTKERDYSLRLDNHGFRYYDFITGRYITRDPLGYRDGMNVYTYVHNNPINHIDPLGLEANYGGEGENFVNSVNLDLPQYSTPIPSLTFPRFDQAMEASPRGPQVSERDLSLDPEANRAMAEFGAKADAMLLSQPSIAKRVGANFVTGALFVDEAAAAINLASGEPSFEQFHQDLQTAGNGVFALGMTLSTLGMGGGAKGLQSVGWAWESELTAAAKTTPSLDALSQAASAADRGGLTAAGRSLTKHGAGARPSNTLFPPAKGNPTSINQAAQDVVDDILTTPGSTLQNSYRGRFGPTIEITAPDGRGVVYDANGKFLFFKE
jgi:RHS repeat-associated protein